MEIKMYFYNKNIQSKEKIVEMKWKDKEKYICKLGLNHTDNDGTDKTNKPKSFVLWSRQRAPFRVKDALVSAMPCTALVMLH